ncbi:MAG: beta-lactamase family protein [Flavobacteriales bacterium]|nr:beta-lactamase family protein [Flavobacteriales bacterium]
MFKKLFYLNLTFLIFSCGGQHEKDNTSAHNERAIQSINGTSITINELDDFLQTQMDSLSIPGLSFAYLSDNKLVYSKNFGITNTETKKPVTDSTLFDAASISKTVFSFFTLQMVDKGLLNLETPLYKYLKNPDIAHDERYKKITARMALSHTTGFPNWRYLGNNGYDPNGKLRIEFEPGTQYQYSGEGFQYLAQVIAHILDTDLNGLQETIKRELFSPLGMTQNSFVWNEYLEKHRADGHIDGSPNPGWSSSSKNPDFNSAASLQTNAVTYGKFLSALMSEKLLSKNNYKEMLKVQSSRPATTNRPDVNYGLGIIVDSTTYGTNYAHSGDNGSATSQFLFNKEHKSGYVFFTNMENDRMYTFNANLRKFLLNSK